MLGLAYLKCFPPFPKGMPYTPDMLRSSQAESFIFINANWFAVAMSLMLAVGFVFKPFFCRMKARARATTRARSVDALSALR